MSKGGEMPKTQPVVSSVQNAMSVKLAEYLGLASDSVGDDAALSDGTTIWTPVEPLPNVLENLRTALPVVGLPPGAFALQCFEAKNAQTGTGVHFLERLILVVGMSTYRGIALLDEDKVAAHPLDGAVDVRARMTVQ